MISLRASTLTQPRSLLGHANLVASRICSKLLFRILSEPSSTLHWGHALSRELQGEQNVCPFLHWYTFSSGISKQIGHFKWSINPLIMMNQLSKYYGFKLFLANANKACSWCKFCKIVITVHQSLIRKQETVMGIVNINRYELLKFVVNATLQVDN